MLNEVSVTRLKPVNFLMGFFVAREKDMDKIEARRSLDALHDELAKYQNLNRTFMNSKQMIAVDEVMSKIRDRMRNIKSLLGDQRG